MFIRAKVSIINNDDKTRIIVISNSAHDRNTKLNLANAYQIKNEAID